MIPCCMCPQTWPSIESLEAHIRHRHTDYDKYRKRKAADNEIRLRMPHYDATYIAYLDAREHFKGQIDKLVARSMGKEKKVDG